MSIWGRGKATQVESTGGLAWEGLGGFLEEVLLVSMQMVFGAWDET